MSNIISLLPTSVIIVVSFPTGSVDQHYYFNSSQREVLNGGNLACMNHILLIPLQLLVVWHVSVLTYDHFPRVQTSCIGAGIRRKQTMSWLMSNNIICAALDC